MSRLETDRNTIHTRIVFWGPAASGKTAMLLALRRALDPEDRTRVYGVSSEEGSTLFFDLLPIEEFTFGSTRVRLRAIGVPGGSDRAAARAALLRHADAVVFVADAARASAGANRESLRELVAGLRSEGVEPGTLPIVWVFNRQDRADVLTSAELRELLATGDAPCFETVATEGSGVLEAFSEIFRQLMRQLAERHAIADAEAAHALPARLLPQLVRGGSRRPGREGEERQVIVRLATGPRPGAAEAIEAQIRLADSHADADAQNRILDGRNRELMAINRVARSILSAMEVNNLLVVLLDATTDFLGATHASVVVFDRADEGSLKTHVTGFGRDPMLRLPSEAARGFFELMEQSDGPIPLDETRNSELFEALRRVDRRVVRAIFQPIKSGDGKPDGWLAIYGAKEDALLTTQHLLFLSSISRLAALGLDKIAQLAELRRACNRLEGDLEDRTGKLEMAQARHRALNRGLESRVTERTRALEEANRALREASARAAYDARLRGMGHLAASFAHEVNNPVAGLVANLEYMREALDDLRAKVAAASPHAAESLGAIADFEQVIRESRQGAARVEGIIATLKRFGGEEEPPETFCANAAVADTVALLEDRIRGRAELELRMGSPPDVKGDAVALRHVVLAVLTNAIEAVERAPGRGQIVVQTYGAQGKATLVVRDTGCGIDPALLPRVFEPFFSTKQGEPGAGLGLHSALRTVEEHGGTIRIKSRPGDGTTVTVEIPESARKPEAAALPGEAQAVAALPPGPP